MALLNYRFILPVSEKVNVFITVFVFIATLLSVLSASAQSRVSRHVPGNYISTTEAKALSSFWSDVVDYGNVAGNCYADGDVELSSGIHVVDEPHLRQIITDANRKANAPVPIQGTIYNMGTGQQVIGSRINEAAGFHCELYRTSTGKYVLGFAGTKLEIGDILNDYKGIDRVYGQSQAAIEVAKDVVRALKDQGISENEIVFTGHSLGGRQAQEASLATGINAIVFNSADLSRETKRTILGESGTNADAYPKIIKVSSANDVLTSIQRDLVGLFGQEVIQNRITIPGGGTHSIKDLNSAINDYKEDATFAELVSYLSKDEQAICFSQYNDYKRDIENANYDIFRAEMHERLVHEMSYEANGEGGVAATPHAIMAMNNKENAKEALQRANRKMEALKEAVQLAYYRENIIQTASIPSHDYDANRVLREYVFDTPITDKGDVNIKDLNEYTISENLSDVAEGGHFLSGKVRVRIILDSSVKPGQYKLYTMDDCRYVFINCIDVDHVDSRFFLSLNEKKSGEYNFGEVSVVRNRDDVIPERSSNNRGLL